MAGTLLLSVQEAEISFGRKILFENLSFNIADGEKICVVGKNGAGKSTLMNIITGKRELDGGLRWQLQGSTVGYLQQDVTFKKGQRVFDYVFDELKQESQDANQTYKIERVVEPLGLHPEAEMATLSGGQLRRAALARALVESPDILLLDEPTNHMDLEVITWLETYLRGYRGALVCISHDRAFLTAISDRVFWLDRGRLRICPKGFGSFEEWSTMLIEQEDRELRKRQKNLEQEVEWASRGVKARVKRNVRRVELMKQERDKLRADKNALARMLARVEFTPTAVDPAASHSICEFHQVCKAYPSPDGREAGKVILDKFNLRIMRGDRIGIVGRNGSGKTTFLKMLMGESTPDSGRVKLAKGLAVSYFDQKRKDLKPELSIKNNLCPNGSDYIEVMGKTRHVCGYMKDFLFDPQDVDRPVSTLSGGQKNRLMLARTLANPGSLLILDEPTNDLDMDTLDMLEDILALYDGTLIVVSHDRDFLDQTVAKTLAFEGEGHVEALIGGYDDYVEHCRRRAEKSGLVGEMTVLGEKKKSAPPPVAAASKKDQKMPYKLQFELSRLPERMAALEAEIGKLEQDLADPDLYAKDAALFQRISKRIAEATHDLGQAEHRWLELEDMRQSYEGS